MASARKKTSRRGQQALLDIGLAAIIATGLGLTYLQITSQDQRTANAVSEGRRLALLSQASATFIKANQAAIQTTLAPGSALPAGCGGTRANNFLSVRPLVDAMPTNATSGGAIVCQTLANARLVPNGLPTTNGYGQTYTLLMALRTSPTGVSYVDAKLTTTGPIAPDDINGSIAETVGTAGGLYASNTTLSNGQITGRTGAWQDAPGNWALNGQNQITPGHAVVNLAYALHSDVGQGLQRFADTATDHSGNKLNTSLYMAGVDNATGAGTNIYMNGTGANQPPVNAVLGARQVDTVTLTNQTPTANDPNVAASASATPNTIDDTNPNTIRVNANLNVTAKNRLAVANGIHVTATGATANADTGATGGIIPGVIWDNGPNSSNAGIGGVALAYDISGTTLGQTGANGMWWLTTYSPKNGTNNADPTNTGLAPVGIYSSGAVMSGVFWSAENSRYFIAPAGQNASLRTDYYKTAQGYTPNGASTMADVNVMGQFSPIIPQYGATAQFNTIAGKRPAPNWQGGVYAVGLYVDGNPYEDRGQPGAVYAANNSYARLGAGKNNVFNTFMDVEGNGYAAKQMVVGTAYNGPQNNYGYQLLNGVNAGIDVNSQTQIGQGGISIARGNGVAVVGYPCQPGYDGLNHAYQIAQAANENGTLLTCQYSAGGQWNWSRNLGRMTTSTYNLDDNVYAQNKWLGWHLYCALSSTAELPPSYVANETYYDAGLPYSPYNVNYMATQLTQQIFVYQSNNYTNGTTGSGVDTNGYNQWWLARAGTRDQYGGQAICLD